MPRAAGPLDWCNVCGQAVVKNAIGPNAASVRIDEDTVVHERCFKCSSCHRRLTLETYRQDELDKRFYCSKHLNGYTQLGSSMSLPRPGRYSVATTTQRNIIRATESPAEQRRRVSSPATSHRSLSQSTHNVVSPRNSFISSANSSTTSALSSSASLSSGPHSPLSSVRNSVVRSPSNSSWSTSTSTQGSGSTTSGGLSRSHSGNDVSDKRIHDSQSPSCTSPTSSVTSSRLKAAKAASQVAEGRADMRNTADASGSKRVQASEEEERNRSGSIPRKADVSRSSSERSPKSAPLHTGVITRRRGSTNFPPAPPDHLDLSQQSSSEAGEDAIDESCSENGFLVELRRYKANCQRIAAAMEETGDVTPTAASNANVHEIPSTLGSITPRSFKRLPIPEMWSSQSETSRFVQPVYGYFTEAIGSPKATTKRKQAPLSPRERAPSPMLDRRSSRTLLVSPDDIKGRFQLEPLKEDLYAEHFLNQEHWNFYVQNEPSVGPVILSLKQEVISERENFRILIRSQFGFLHGLLPPTCLLANRYNRKDVVAALRKEMGFMARFRQAMTANSPSDIMKLDKAFSSRQLKVGVLYIAPGQRTEEEIFNNANGSRNFDEFMSEIGNRITLKDFHGFRGGLDAKHEQTGEHSLYREWNEHEIMFHVSTLLPHAEKDRQQLQKKRHIGNDMVCIVFVDDMETPFNPTCIRSHFLHSFIVVHCDSVAFPKRYRVDVVARDSVPHFGPSLSTQNVFQAGTQLFSEFLLTKLVNGYRATCRASKFNRLKVRTLTQMIKEVTNTFALHEVETANRQRRITRRGSWLPEGAVRPPSPLRDSVKEQFIDSERLSQDLQDLRTACKDICDVNFIVGERRDAVCGIKAVMCVRSAPFRDFFHNLQMAMQAEEAAPAEAEAGKLPKRGTSSNRLKLHLPKKDKSASSSKDSSSQTPTPTGTTSSPIVRRKSRKSRKAPSTESTDSGTRSQDDDPVFSPPAAQPGTDDMGIIQENEVLQIKAPPLSMIITQMAKGIEVFEVHDFTTETFSAALDFIHSGACDILPGNVVGLCCAAALMDIDGLEKACIGGVSGLLRADTIMDVLKGERSHGSIWGHLVAKKINSSVSSISVEFKYGVDICVIAT